MKRTALIGIAFLAAGLAGCAGTAQDTGWIMLIDGTRGMENFNRIGNSNWRAEDGAIVADKNPDKTASYLVTKSSYKDFVIRAEFWTSHDSNSGIFCRCANPAKITDDDCYEANIFDQRPDPTYGTGAIVKVAKVASMPKAGGKWNTYEVTMKGSHLVLVLNGVKTIDVQDSKLASGPVALQHGTGVIKWRKVEIKPL